MPQTLSFPPPMITVVTMTGRPMAAANGQCAPLYLRTQDVIDGVEEAVSLVPWRAVGIAQ